MARHRLYGVRGCKVDGTAEAVGARLGRTFEDRESEYLGAYKLAAADSLEIRVVGQPDPAGDPLEDQFPDYDTLIFVDVDVDLEVPDLSGLEVANSKIVLLREEP